MDCGEIELALRGNDESECSENPTVFIGVVDFVASVDAVVQEHLQSVNVTVFLKEHLRQYRMNSLF